MENVGIDIVQTDRIREHVNDERFVERILSPGELDKFYSFNENRRIEFLSGRFAAKEAIIKCLSDYEVPILNELDIFNDEKGKPIIRYRNYDIALSISHERDYAVAIAVLKE